MKWKDEKISDKYYAQNSYSGESIAETKRRLLGKRAKRVAKKLNNVRIKRNQVEKLITKLIK